MSTEYIWYNGKYQAVGDSEVVRQLRVKVVSSLPTEGSPGYIYIVPGEAGSDIPEYSTADAEKVLKVNSSGSALQWGTIKALPDYSVQEAEKVLKVNTQGTGVEWGDAAPVMVGGDGINVNDTIITAKIDTATQEFVNGNITTKAVKCNNSTTISFWKGTQDEYDSIQNKDANTFYIIIV